MPSTLGPSMSHLVPTDQSPPRSHEEARRTCCRSSGVASTMNLGRENPAQLNTYSGTRPWNVVAVSKASEEGWWCMRSHEMLWTFWPGDASDWNEVSSPI